LNNFIVEVIFEQFVQLCLNFCHLKTSKGLNSVYIYN